MNASKHIGRLRNTLRGLRHGERAQGLVEYALIIVVVSLGTIAALTFLRGEIRGLFSKAGSSIQLGADGTSGGGSPAPLNQTITFLPLSDRALGSGTFALSASASSGLAVAFASATTGQCTVAGTTVTLVAVGTCTINANQPGNGTYNAAPQVAQSFQITAAAAAPPDWTFVTISGTIYVYFTNPVHFGGGGDCGADDAACSGHPGIYSFLGASSSPTSFASNVGTWSGGYTSSPVWTFPCTWHQTGIWNLVSESGCW